MKLILLSLAVLSAVAVSGCKPSGSGSGSGKKKIVFVTNAVDPFWNNAAAGVRDAGPKFGVDSETIMPTEGVADQKRIIEDLLTKGVDGISVSPIDPANQNDILNTAAGRTKLITNDSDAPTSNRLLYIGMDNYKAGRMTGELVREALPQGGSVMIFIGRMEQDNSKDRRQGTIDGILGRSEDPTRFDPPGIVIEEAGFKIVGTLTDNFDRGKAKHNVEDTLSKHPDIAGMVGLFGYNPPMILEVLAQANKLRQVKVIGFDENEATLAGIQDGTVHGTVVQNPYMYGYKSVEVLSELIKGNNTVIPANKMIDIPARQIRKDNVDVFWAELKKTLGTTQ